MKMYIIDIGGTREGLDEINGDAMKAELLFLNRDLFRGFTLNPLTIRLYARQMEQIMGQYVIFETFEYDVPEDLPEDKYVELAMKFYEDLVEEGIASYGSSCLELISYPLENGGQIIATEPLLEMSTSSYNYDNILDQYIILLDDIFDYLYEFHSDTMVQFKEFILSELREKIDDLFDISGRWVIDPYAIFLDYLTKMKFLN